MKYLYIFVLLFLTAEVFGTTYYTISNSNWYTTQGGSSCGCTPDYNTDELHIYHNRNLNGLNATSSDIHIYAGNTKLNWHATIGANASITVHDGGTLKSGVTVTNYGTITVNSGGKYSPNGGGFNNYGDLIINDGATSTFKNLTLKVYSGGNVEIYNDNFTVQNGGLQMDGGTLTLEGDMNVKSATFQINSPATAVINGVLSVKNATFQNNSSITGSGVIEKANNASSQNNGTVNGCSSCSIGSSVNYLAASTPSGSSSNVTVYMDASWSNGTPSSCTAEVVVMEDLSLSSDLTMSTLTVRSGVTLTIAANQALSVCTSIENNGSVVVENTGSLVQTSSGNANSGSGTYTINRTASTSNGEYNIWTSPVTSQSITSFFADDNLYDVFTFDPTVQTWKYDFDSMTPENGHAYSPFQFASNNMVSGSDGIFDVARGYFAPGRSIERTFSGTVNNGDVSISISTSNATTPVSWGGNDWNVVGNPYPSAISATDFLDENYNGGAGIIANAVYYWDDPSDGYITKNTTDNDLIGKCQGFWVAALSDGQVTFTNSMRTSTLSSMRSRSKVKVAYLNMTNTTGLVEEIRVYLDDSASDEEDNLFDAMKLENGSGFNFYSKLNTINYVFQSVTDLELHEKKTVELGFTANSAGLYALSLDSLANIPDNYGIYIEDLQKTLTFDIRTKGSFYIQLDSAGTYDGRFLLHIIHHEADSTVNPNPDPDTNVVNSVIEYTALEGVRVYPQNGNQLIVAFDQVNPDQIDIDVIDMTGRVLQSRKLSPGSLTYPIDITALRAGIYLTRIRTADQRFTTLRFYKR